MVSYDEGLWRHLSQTKEMAAGESTNELRIVLLGNREGGKSSAGNTILGREEFDPDVRTLQCVKRQGDVAGRLVTVVDTPGWTEYNSIYCKYSPNLLKWEIVLSVTLCPPGPHAFLLVIHENMTFTEAERNATSNHLSLLGHGAWKHSLVLFTRETPAEEKTFEIKGKLLQWLVEKCGNRYHVLNVKSKDDTQIKELLEKIEEMVAANNGLHYETNGEKLQEVEEKRMRGERRAEEKRKEIQRQRDTANFLKGDTFLPDFRIVLLGFKDSGKSSSGNTILGREEFQPGQRSAVCVKRQGEVAGRQVTVVETPGWWGCQPRENSSEMLKREIVLSPGLCKQGPHCFCFILQVDAAFTEEHKTSIHQHLFLLGETVWSHTMVLFTHGDWLGDTTIEQHIESEGALQCLVEKCGNRYHVFNNKRKDLLQVRELLEKVEEMVSGNNGGVYEVDMNRVQEVRAQKTKVEEQAKERIGMKKERDGSISPRVQTEWPVLRMVLLGSVYDGKSSSGNTILGNEEFELRKTAECVKRQGEVAGRQITVVEAPGWWGNVDLAGTPELIKEEIVLSMSPPGPHAILLVINADSPFTEASLRSIQEHMGRLGERVWDHTMLLFTYGDQLGGTTIEEHIESEENLHWLIEKCGNRHHVLNNSNRNDNTQVTELLKKIEQMATENRCPYFEMEKDILGKALAVKQIVTERAQDRLMNMRKQRLHLQELKRESSPMSEFRVVLLGYRGSGKSSSVNTVLGREEFDLKRRTAQCVKRQGEVAGRQVTVVEAPGWWNNCNVKATPELTKEEIVLSVSLCPPGPHAILLLIRADFSVTEEQRESMTQHLCLLSDKVWAHTMVLFTCGDWLGDTTIEQYIENERALQSLVEKCGNRYHVLNNVNWNDDQVTELLQKIEEMMAGNKNNHFEMDREKQEETLERRRKEEERATERLMKVKKEREHLQSLTHNSFLLSEFRLVLLGHRASGKSSLGNTILGREEFDLKRRTTQCVRKQGEVADRQITVVKAPGWWKNFNLKMTSKLTKQELVYSVCLCPPGPHILLLLVRIDICYTQDDVQNIQEHLEFISDRVWSHTMVLFTHEEWLGNTTIEQYIESEEHLRYLVEKCGNRYHVVSNGFQGDRTQITELMKKMEEIIAGNGGRHFEMDRKRQEEVKEMKEKQERATERLMNVERQRQHLQSMKQNSSPLPEFRVVLLGYRSAGKSSSGNTILGREEFDLKRRTAQCVKRQGEVAGRQITVVKAPGWWENQNLQLSCQFTKQELVYSVCLCSPGPQILLLLVRVADSLTHSDIRNIQEHVEFISERVWSYTMVLFTRGDWLGDTSIEQYIESEEPLRDLVEKCGNRYHVLNNAAKSDRTQITELMEKMEEIIAGNGGCHFEMDRKRLEEVKGRREKEEERATERLMKVKKQRQQLQSLKQYVSPLSELRFVLLGYRGSWKSLSGNTILGREEFDIRTRTTQCIRRQGEVGGRQVTAVEAPGWIHFNFTPQLTKDQIVLSASLCPPGPHIFLLLVGSILLRDYTENIEAHVSLLGEEVWNHTMVLFTCGDWLGDTIVEQYIESEEQLRYLVEKCGNRYHVLNNFLTGDRTQITELMEKMEEIIAGNGGRHFAMDRQRQVEVKERSKKQEEGATERLMKVERQRLHLQSLKQKSCSHSEFRVVLLGHILSGKSSSGNIILGREEFDLKRTAQCVKRQGEVTGSHVTVVEVPGWWKNQTLDESCELTKQEMLHSVCLCPPGPHILLLFVQVGTCYTQDDVQNIQEHLEFISDRVWSHTLVLFTNGDLLGNTAIEQYIESEEHLKYLVEKCGNRYHVLNNGDKGDRTQITELMEKMEEIITGNGGRHFEMDRKRQEEVKERKEKEEKRARERLMKVEKQKEHTLSMKHSSPISEFRVVMLGSKGSGKSSSGNTIFGREEFDLKRSTAQCVKRQGEVAGRQVTVVKAPGWWKDQTLDKSCELTKKEILYSVCLCPPGPHILLLFVKVGTRDDMQNIQEHVEFIHYTVWNHTMVLFTHRDWLGDTSIEQYIESEEHLRYLVEKCGNRYHVLNNGLQGNRTQITELMEKMEEIITGNGGRHFQMDRNRQEEVKERREKEKERAKERLMKVKRQRQHLQSLKRESPPLSELRIVMLGYRGSGKSSSGNTILGREEFDLKRRTAQCVKRQGEAAGRQVTVVEAPGWWTNQNLCFHFELTKQELVYSVCLCPPGPHILLLLVRIGICNTSYDMQNIQMHLESISARVWSHTMVLFTHGDWLGNTTIEQYIESEEHLRYLVEKCGNRYHVLNNGDKGDRTQITELMEKMEEIIAGKEGRPFEMDRKRQEEVKERREKEENRATERLMKVEKQRQHLQSLKQKSSPLSEFRIVLLGNRSSGKSSSGNTILGREEFDLKRRTAQCVKRQGEVAGRQVTIVEAPGWWDNINIKDTPELNKQEIVLSVCLCPPGPHIFLLMVQIAFPFTEEIIKENIDLLGDQVWSHTMLLFTHGDWLGDTTIEHYIESKGVLQSLVEKCGNRYHVLNNKDRQNDVQVIQLLEKIEEMVAGNGGSHFEMAKNILRDIEKKRSRLSTKVEDREARVYKQEALFKYVMGEPQPLSEVRMVFLHYADEHEREVPGGVTLKCEREQKIREGREINIDHVSMRASKNSLQETKAELVSSLSLCDHGPHAFLLRVDTHLHFTERRRIHFQTHLGLLGDRIWDHAMVFFYSLGDPTADRNIEEYIESEGLALQWLVEKCGNRYVHWTSSARITDLLNKIEEMVVLNEGSHFQHEESRTRKISDTASEALSEHDSWISAAKSRQTPPLLGEDDRSGITSGYHTYTSDSTPEAPPERDPTATCSETQKRHQKHEGFCPLLTDEDELSNAAEDSFIVQRSLEFADTRSLGTEYLNMDEQSNCCKSCKDVEDTSHWIQMEPLVSMETGEPVYKHSSPPGSFECTVSGLRWVCAGDITLQYQFSDPDIFRGELAMLQYAPIGPLMDIKVVSGELLEAHLPHFACLEGSHSSLREAVRVLHGGDSGVTLEKCELTRFHAKLLKPSFSLTEILVRIGIPVKTHLEVLIYRTRVKPLVLLTYVVPRDASMIQAVEKDVSKAQGAKEIKTHRPDMPIRMNTKFSLNASHNSAKTSPSEITLKYIKPPDLFRMVIENAEDSLDLELVSEGRSIWKATLETFEYGDTQVASSEAMLSGASRPSQGMIHREESHTSSAAGAREEKGKMAPMTSNKDQVSCIRPDLIERTSEGVLKGLLLGLESHQPPVLNSMEAQVILQRTNVLQDQVTFLVDMVIRKGCKACGVMLSLLKDLDPFLYQDLGL